MRESERARPPLRPRISTRECQPTLKWRERVAIDLLDMFHARFLIWSSCLHSQELCFIKGIFIQFTQACRSGAKFDNLQTICLLSHRFQSQFTVEYNGYVDGPMTKSILHRSNTMSMSGWQGHSDPIFLPIGVSSNFKPPKAISMTHSPTAPIFCTFSCFMFPIK